MPTKLHTYQLFVQSKSTGTFTLQTTIPSTHCWRTQVWIYSHLTVRLGWCHRSFRQLKYLSRKESQCWSRCLVLHSSIRSPSRAIQQTLLPWLWSKCWIILFTAHIMASWRLQRVGRVLYHAHELWTFRLLHFMFGSGSRNVGFGDFLLKQELYNIFKALFYFEWSAK